MSIEVMSDPIIDIGDAKSLLDIKNDVQARVIVNSLTMKFRQFTGRIQLSQDADNDTVEYLRGETPNTLYLHCSPILAEDHDVEVDIFDGHNVIETYKYSDEEISCFSDDMSARLESAGLFPVRHDKYTAKVTYRGGWTAIPGDVIEGAIFQGRADLHRQSGEVGMSSRSEGGESTAYDTRGILKTVQELWAPYRVLL